MVRNDILVTYSASLKNPFVRNFREFNNVFYVYIWLNLIMTSPHCVYMAISLLKDWNYWTRWTLLYKNYIKISWFKSTISLFLPSPPLPFLLSFESVAGLKDTSTGLFTWLRSAGTRAGGWALLGQLVCLLPLHALSFLRIFHFRRGCLRCLTWSFRVKTASEADPNLQVSAQIS